MNTLAGVTAMVSNVSPMPAALRVRLNITPIAPSNSKTPLTMTARSGKGIVGGTICTKSGVYKKWQAPPIRKYKNTNYSPLRRPTDILLADENLSEDIDERA